MICFSYNKVHILKSIARLSLMCRHNTSSSFVLAIFLSFRSGTGTGLKQSEEAANVLRQPSESPEN